MEKLTKKYNDLLKIYSALTMSIERYRESLANKTLDLITREERRDSLIKRFDLTYDLLWKYLQGYIRATHGGPVNSPYKIFQKCFALGITNKEETEQLLDLIEDRNLTAHVYNIDVANQVAADIQKHRDVIATIIKKVSLDTRKNKSFFPSLQRILHSLG